MGRPQTIDDYLEGFTGQRHDLLARLRGLAREAVPEAAEAIKWGNPSWVHPSGTILFMIAGYSRHANVAFTPSTREAFQDELTGWATGKGTIQLPYDQAVPSDLLRRMIAFRVREHEEDGVLWM